MAKTATAEQVKTNTQEAPPGGAVALAEETPKSLASRGLTLEQWRVLKETIFPAAQSKEAIFMAIDYCKARNLDIFKKPVHIVPIWSKEHKRMVETVWPGISELRTTAARTGRYAGKSAPEWGPDKTEHLGDVAVTYPEYCRMTVYKMVGNNRVAYTSEVYWKETYATAGRDTTAPNAMWKKRPMGQLAKCFDPETEILTTDGFQRFDSVTGDVLQVTSRGLERSMGRPFRQDYDGEMIVADGTRLNFCVTPNHDMATNLGRIPADLLFDMATKDAGKLSIPRVVTGTRDGADVADNILILLGAFLADGYAHYNQFTIAVSRAAKVEAIDQLGLHTHRATKAEAGDVAYSNGRTITTSHDKTAFTFDFALIAPYVSREKVVVADRILELSMRQARVLVDTLLAFDGSDNGVGVRRFYSSNTNILAAFEVAAIAAGLSIGNKVERTSDIGTRPNYSVTVAIGDTSPVVRGVAKNTASLVKRKNVAGVVWCVTVPSGMIVVRRHGFSMLCHNCAEAEALREAFPEEIGGEYSAEEMSGQMRDITPVDPGPADPRPARKDYESRKAEAMGSAEIIEPEAGETKPAEWPYADPQGVIEEYPDAESFANAFLIDLQKMVKDGAGVEELRTFRDSNMESIEALRGPGGDQDASALVWRNLNALKDGGKM